MGNKIIGIFNILVGAAGIYMVGFKGAQFVLFPSKEFGYVVCGLLIAYGIYILVRKPKAAS